MFDAELFIESLFEDTTQSTLVFDLLEGLSSRLQALYDPLIRILPETLNSHTVTFEENYMFPPTLLCAHFEQGLFYITFETICELNAFKANRSCGSIQLPLIATAQFVLKSEGGSTRITQTSPPTTYENYAPVQLVFTGITFDKTSVQYSRSTIRQGFWPFK
ncbi:MAG: hypothetical protein ACRCW2_00905 [Cellulosilyticaceae bacterium]